MATVATKPAEITAVAQACGRARRTVRLGGPGVVILPFSINASHQESRVAEEEPMGSARRLASRQGRPMGSARRLASRRAGDEGSIQLLVVRPKLRILRRLRMTFAQEQLGSIFVHFPALSLWARRAPPGIGFDGGALLRRLDRTRPHRANLRDRLSGGHAPVYQVGREQGASAAKASGTVNHHPLA